MSTQDPGLTDADRKAIADIRRELDAEFGPLEEPASLDLQEERELPRAPLGEPPAGAPSWRPGVIAAFVTGLLLGALAGGVGTLAWLLHTTPPLSTSSPAAPPARDENPAAPARVSPSTRAGSPSPADAAAASLHDALEEWLEATRRGDIPAQMQFYPSRVPVYYTWRDVPRETVRTEKVKVFGGARRLEIDAGAPEIEIADDGATGVTRFSKRYVIEGPALRRRGEVLQELRWARTAEGWRIVSERDARVLAAD